MPHRFAALALASAVGLTLAASVPAFAQDKPIIGSTACNEAVTAEVALDATVIAATKVATPLVELAQLPAATEEQKAAAEDANDALADVTAKVRAALELDLCAPLPVDTDDPGTSDPGTDDPGDTGSETPNDPGDDTPTVPVLTDDRDCGDFDSQEAAQTYFLAHRTSAQPDPDRLDANNNGIACEGSFDESTSATVDPLADDGSTANVSGNQVTVVPQGSAQTGSL